MKPLYYKLADDRKTPIPVEDVREWAEFFEIPDARRVAETKLPGGVRVSTVFLCIDHAFGDDPPVLWETMIFGGSLDQEQWRYHSWEEAMAGHDRAVCQAKAGKLDEV